MNKRIYFFCMVILLTGCASLRPGDNEDTSSSSALIREFNQFSANRKGKIFLRGKEDSDGKNIYVENGALVYERIPSLERKQVPLADVNKVVFIDHAEGAKKGFGGGALLGAAIGGTITGLMMANSGVNKTTVLVGAFVTSAFAFYGSMIVGPVAAIGGKHYVYTFTGQQNAPVLTRKFHKFSGRMEKE